MNISSLPYHIDDFRTLLSMIDTKFDIIAITEARLKHSLSNKTNVSLNNYNLEVCSTESTKGGAALYIKKI